MELNDNFEYLSNLSLEELEVEKNKFYSFQYALKILSNLLYGVIGNVYFFGFNKDVVETVTLQARDVLFYMIDFFNFYFKNYWLSDKELHKKLGIKVNKNVDENIDVVVFSVTDSIFLRFDCILETIENFDNLNKLKFILDLYEYRLKGLIEEALNNYAKLYNTKNCLNLSLEYISKKVIWTGKNRYILYLIWNNNSESTFKIEDKEYNGILMDKVKVVGIEVKSRKYSEKVRNLLMDIIEYFMKTDNLLPVMVNEKIKESKYLFSSMKIEDISFVSVVHNYNNYVLDDKSYVKLKKGCPVQVKAAAIYNYLIFKNKLNNKYNYLKDGDRIMFYYSKNGYGDVFAFGFDEFPYEIAPDYDYDMMFNKMIMNVINRIKLGLFDKVKNKKESFVQLEILF